MCLVLWSEGSRYPKIKLPLLEGMSERLDANQESSKRELSLSRSERYVWYGVSGLDPTRLP